MARWCPLLSNESPKLIAQKFMIFFFFFRESNYRRQTKKKKLVGSPSRFDDTHNLLEKKLNETSSQGPLEAVDFDLAFVSDNNHF